MNQRVDVVGNRAFGVVQPQAFLELRHQRGAGVRVDRAVRTGHAEGVVDGPDAVGFDVHVHRRQEAAGLHHGAGHYVPAALCLVRVGADRHHVRAQVDAFGLDGQRVLRDDLAGVAKLAVDGQLDVLAADGAAGRHCQRLCIALRQIDLRHERIDGRADRAGQRASGVGYRLLDVPQHRRVECFDLVVA